MCFSREWKTVSANLFRRMFVWVKKMMEYREIDVSERIDMNKIGTWLFKNVGYKFIPHICNKCHDVLAIAYESKNIAILAVKGVDYRCI